MSTGRVVFQAGGTAGLRPCDQSTLGAFKEYQEGVKGGWVTYRHRVIMGQNVLNSLMKEPTRY